MTTELNNRKIAYLTVDGWGVVSALDYFVGAVDINATSGLGTLQMTGSSVLTSSQIGSTVYFSQSAPTSLEVFGTLLSASANGSTVQVQFNPDQIDSTYNGFATGSTRIEDHYKLSTGIPDYVTGEDARSRWFTGITSFTPTIGTEIKPLGGVSSVDGFSINHNTFYETGFAKTRFDVLGEIISGTITKAFIPLDTQETEFAVTGDVTPWAGSYNDGVRPPTAGLYEPVFMGSEAMMVTSSSDVFHPVGTIVGVKRGLLGTDREVHSVGSIMIDGFTTPLGRRGTFYIGEKNDESQFDAEQAYSGLIGGLQFANGVSEQTISISSNTFETWANSVILRQPPKAEWEDGWGNTILAQQYNPASKWRWIKAGDACFRLKGDPEQIGYDTDPLSGHLTYRYDVDVELNGDQGINAIAVDTLSVEDYSKLNDPNRPEVDQWGNDPDIQGLSELIQFPGGLPAIITHWTSFNTTSGYGGEAFWGVARYPLRQDQEEIQLAHVFEGDDSGLFSYSTPEFSPPGQPQYPSERLITCSPIDALLQIITTQNGDGKNTITYNGTEYNFDKLPSELGLGLTQDDIDVDSFFDIGFRMVAGNLNVINAHIAAEDVEKMKKWIEENLLQPFFLALVTDSRGKLKLIDVTDASWNSDLVEITNTDLYRQAGDVLEVEYAYSSENLLDQVAYEVIRPWISPTSPDHEDKIFIQSVNDGISNLFQKVSENPKVIKPKVGVVFEDEASEKAFAQRAAALIANYRSIVPKLSIPVSRDLDVSVGDKVLINIANLPMNRGAWQRDAQSAIGLITSIAQDITSWINRLEVVLIDTNPSLSEKRKWSAAATVDSKTSNTEFTVSTSDFTPDTEWAPFEDDVDAFSEDDYVILIDVNGVILSVDGSGDPQPRQITDITGNVITIDAAFSDASSSAIDPVGHYIIHGAESLQPTLTQGKFMWSNHPLAYKWELL
jgi:hypothetical protein